MEYKFIETIRDLFIPAYRRTDQMERVISTECEEEMVSDIVIEFPAGKSDHSVISFQFNAYITETPIEKKNVR